MAAFRRNDVYPAGHDDDGESTIEATVGGLLEAQSARATVEIAAVLKGLRG